MKLLLILGLLLSLAPLGQSQVAKPKPQAQAAKAARATVMVRVADDGSLSDVDYNPLADDEALTEYLKRKKEELEVDKKEPQLVLRGEKKVLYEHGRDVIRKSFKVGIKRTVYSSIIRPTLLTANGHIPDPREHERIIAITADGRVTMNGEAMDSGPDDRALKRMAQKLQIAAKKHEEGAMGLTVYVLADNNAKHPRVIDVLNALSEAKIRSVRFAGPEEKK